MTEILHISVNFGKQKLAQLDRCDLHKSAHDVVMVNGDEKARRFRLRDRIRRAIDESPYKSLHAWCKAYGISPSGLYQFFRDPMSRNLGIDKLREISHKAGLPLVDLVNDSQSERDDARRLMRILESVPPSRRAAFLDGLEAHITALLEPPPQQLPPPDETWEGEK
ncbi:hypothetical protein [Roseospira visakhapatnamensis]|uniref:Uncharacterized protein n=1 Tax=Roseospira visakhapatnamensis TaxID=390880 RepID=A0A7W6RG59_9PROT|nr:hypothetical protein [Roseospira visakhapatnamensis]MBB4267702.1 hypothetical protein [Roseospira visakhapatnamensis]